MEGFKHLVYVFVQIEAAQDHFREYLNTGSKEHWDNYIIEHGFVFNLCRIMDEKLLPKNYLRLIKNILKIDNQVYSYNDYLPDKRLEIGSEKVLCILNDIKKQVLALLKVILKNNKSVITYLDTDKSKKDFLYIRDNFIKTVDPEFYSLLQSLKVPF